MVYDIEWWAQKSGEILITPTHSALSVMPDAYFRSYARRQVFCVTDEFLLFCGQRISVDQVSAVKTCFNGPWKYGRWNAVSQQLAAIACLFLASYNKLVAHVDISNTDLLQTNCIERWRELLCAIIITCLSMQNQFLHSPSYQIKEGTYSHDISCSR